MPVTRGSPDDPAPARQPRLAVLVVACALFRQNRDGTGIATALRGDGGRTSARMA